MPETDPPASPASARASVRRHRERGSYDRAVLHAILDEGLVCHVGFEADGSTYVIPTGYARVEDVIYLHGAAGNHMLAALAGGAQACVTVTLLDGLVLARASVHHSMNYRSAVIFSNGSAVLDPSEKLLALNAIVEHIVPGRTSDARPPTADELRTTLVVRLPIEEFSAKVRVGPPIDDEADQALPIWAGVIPLRLEPGPPVPASDGTADLATPRYATRYRVRRGRPARTPPAPRDRA